jgi:hypothetical protein
MKTEKRSGNQWTLKKIILIVIIILLAFVIVEQVSVYHTLNGDGKIHHVGVRPAVTGK